MSARASNPGSTGESTPRVFLGARLYQRIKEQAGEGLPNEICGYLSSAQMVQNAASVSEIEITGVYPLRNVDESPEHYRFDPSEQFEVFKRVKAGGEMLIGTYHSHPETPSRMSDEDIRLAQDEKMLYGIYSVKDELLNFFTVKKDSNGKKQVRKLNIKIVN